MDAPPTFPAPSARHRPQQPLRADGSLWRVESPDGQARVLRAFPAPAASGDPAAALRARLALWTLVQPRHAALAGILEHGVAEDGRPWVVLPWTDRPRLAAAGPLAPAAAARLLADLLGALDALHRHGLVHGALDARRVRVGPDGRALLMDAGAATAALEGRGGRPDLDPRGDLRAAGALVLAALAPAAEPGPVAAALPGAAGGVLARLLADDPAAGFASAREALVALGLAVEGGDALLPAAPLIGREAELAGIATALDAVRAGGAGGLTWLAGAAGMGKSRLLDAFARAAAQAQIPLGRAEAGAAGANEPYGPLVRALRGLLPALRQAVPDALTRHAPVLGRLLPELAPTGFAPALEPPSARLRLQGAVAELLVALAKARGLVLVLEDWERVDPLTTEAMARIRRAALGLPLAIVVSAETAEARPDWAQEAALVELAALTPADLGALAAALLGLPAAPAGLAERLAQASGGLPLRAEAVLRGLVATGALRRGADGTWQLVAGAADEPAPEDPLAGLAPEAVAVARAAAALGGAADLDVLAAMTAAQPAAGGTIAEAGMGDDALFSGLALLRRAGLLMAGVDGALGFGRPALAAYILDALPPATRQALHAAAAAGYAARLASDDPAQAPLATAAAIARHALLAGDAELATPFALDAGRRLAAMHASADAEELLDAGLVAVRDAGRAAWIGRRLAFLEALADVRRIGGKLPGAKAGYEEAERLADALADRRRLGRILGSLAKIHQVLDDLPAAQAACARALVLAEATDDADGLARSLLTMARLRVYAGKLEEARDLAQAAIAPARAAEDPARVAEATALLGFLLADVPGSRATGIERLQEAMAMLTTLGDPIGLNMAASMLGDAQAAGGELEAARKSYTLARWILNDVGLLTEAGITAINLGLAALELGEPLEAAERAAEARGLAEANGHRFQRALAEGLAAAAAAARGELAAGLAHAAAAEEEARDLANHYLDVLLQPLVVEAYLRAGDLEAAQRAGQALDGPEAPASAARRLALLAEAWGRAGDLARAGACAGAAREAAEAADAPVERARARRLAAWLALLAGDVAAARHEALEAKALAERHGLKLQAAAVEGLLGEAARQAGDADPRPHFLAMQALAADAGARWLAAEALLALGGLDPGGPARAEAERLVAGATAGMDPAARARVPGPWIARQVGGPEASSPRNTPATPNG